MCGISGIIYKPNTAINKSEIEKMTDMVIHRGPDGYGYFWGEYFGLGHRRLAILDLSESGHQPMHYMGRYTITYNGEVYNYLELKEELIKYGYSFKSTSDTEVILASYDRWGEDCVHYFNGMWAFAIYDKAKNIIFCSRDRFGIKPFYYAEIDGKFAFCSEIKQFTVLGGWKAKLNKPRAYDFLESGLFDHTDETMFNGVHQLRGGRNLVYDLNTHTYKVFRWYDLQDKLKNGLVAFDHAVDRFRDIFVDSVRLMLRSDVKVGSCLSGGLDSSSIVCVMNDLLRKQNGVDKQETVSSCFDIKEYDEQEYIDEVIKKTGVVNHRVYPKLEDLFKDLDKIIFYQDEPFGSTSIFAQWNVFKTAKQKNITVMLDGQGADEQLLGYHGYYDVYFDELFRKWKIITLFKELYYYKKLHGYSVNKIFNRFLSSFLKRIIQLILSLRHKKLETTSDNNNSFLNLNKHGYPFPLSLKSLKNLSLSHIVFSNLPMLLHYEDRNSMAFSVESRVPFLDHRLVEEVVNMPDDFKIRNGETKYVLRNAMKNILPEKINRRYSKLGFATPEEVWIKQNAETFKKDLKEAISLSKGVISEKILTYFDDVISGKIGFSFTIWRYIAFGRWMKVYGIEI